MKNVYDILVNFKRTAYEFYEWRKDDDIEHIKVIPSFKVSDECVVDLLHSDVVINKDFLKLIDGKTETFCNRIVKIIDYACVFFNDETCVAVEFNRDGELIGKSKLLFDEADDVVDSGRDVPVTKINYTVKATNNLCKDHTRKEQNIITLLSKYLDSIFNKKNKDEIRYMYYECFDEAEENYDKAYKKLKANVDNANLVVINKLKSLIKVLKK